MKYLVNGGCFGCSNCDYAFGLGYQGAIRQDTLARKVFIVLPDSITESILYDFTQNVGDTLNSILSDFCYPDIISSIDSILIGNTYHRKSIPIIQAAIIPVHNSLNALEVIKV